MEHPAWLSVGGIALMVCSQKRPRDQVADLELWVPVRILQTAVKFGDLRVLVTPVGGCGQQWVGVQKLAEQKG